MMIYGFHSLRHSFTSRCAEAGVPKAVLLPDSDIADKYYIHIGDEAQGKAIAAIAGSVDAKSDRERIADALAFIKSSTVPAEEALKQGIRILNR